MHLKSKETKITRDTGRNLLTKTFTRYALFTSTVMQAWWIDRKVYIYIQRKISNYTPTQEFYFDQTGIWLLGARRKRQIMGRKAQQKSPGNTTVQTSRGLENGEKGRPFFKPIASGAFVFAKTTYTDIPANPRNVITLHRWRSPSPLFPPLHLVFRRLPRRLAPGALKPLFVWSKILEDRKVTCLPATHGEPLTLARQG